MILFTDIKQFIAIKSSTKKGVIQGQKDMIEEGKVPISKPLKNKEGWVVIIAEYKNKIECQVN